MPASRILKTESMARCVRILSCVTSVPSTSAMTRRIGFLSVPGFCGIVFLFCRCFLLLLVIPGEATVDECGCAGHIVGVRRSKKGGDAGDVFRLSQAVERNIFQEWFQLRRIVQQIFVDGSFDRAGGDGIDGDAQWGELDGEVAGHHLDAAFAGAVRRKVREGKLFVYRADVDDLAAGSCLHAMFDEGLRNEKWAFQVYVKDQIVS